MDKIYRVLYCSRNYMDGTAEEQLQEVRKILGSSRRNNSALGVTGALLFNRELFAQVLEGPLDAVERTFEKIQLDSRHDDVAVLEASFVAIRDFPTWSMAFAGMNQGEYGVFEEFKAMEAPSDRSDLAEQIGDLLRSLVRQDESESIGT